MVEVGGGVGRLGGKGGDQRRLLKRASSLIIALFKGFGVLIGKLLEVSNPENDVIRIHLKEDPFLKYGLIVSLPYLKRALLDVTFFCVVVFFVFFFWLAIYLFSL